MAQTVPAGLDPAPFPAAREAARSPAPADLGPALGAAP
jgi:hypothetical protein